jgi:hypothetical protein
MDTVSLKTKPAWVPDSIAIGSAAMRSRKRSLILLASYWSTPGSRIANSSPPNLPIRSCCGS